MFVLSAKLATLNHEEPLSSDVTTAVEQVFETSDESTSNEVATLTDICYESLGDGNFVDLVSLIEEQLPAYTLRADAITSFAGYENADWIVKTPCLPPDLDLDISPAVIEETLKYFVFCGERLTRMTQTYNDISAVTLLLREKERDLELAAKIGQKLLADNQSLLARNDELDSLLHEATETVSQLKHVVSIKDNLLKVYTKDSGGEDSPQSPISGSCSSSSRPGSAVVSQGCIEGLRKKVAILEEENVLLKVEHDHLASEAVDLEEQEAELVRNAVTQLAENQREIDELRSDLKVMSKENATLHSRVVELVETTQLQQQMIEKASVDNTELQQKVKLLTQIHEELANEVLMSEERFVECHSRLLEAQEEVRDLERRQRPGVLRYHNTQMSPYVPGDSLALELEDSIRRNIVFPDGYSPAERKIHSLRAMKTARSVKSARKLNIDNVHQLCNEAVPESSRTEKPYFTDKAGRLSIHDCEEDDDDDDRCNSPDSYLSTGSNNCSESCVNDAFSAFLPHVPRRIPERIQLLKPMKGSYALHRWQSLATPDLSGILNIRPGIQIKGERQMDFFREDPYSLSDLEEDDNCSPLTMHAGNDSLTTCTYTVSKTTQQAAGIHTTISFTKSGCVPTKSSSVCSTTTSRPLTRRSLASDSKDHRSSSVDQFATVTSNNTVIPTMTVEEETIFSSWWNRLGLQRRFTRTGTKAVGVNSQSPHRTCVDGTDIEALKSDCFIPLSNVSAMLPRTRSEEVLCPATVRDTCPGSLSHLDLAADDRLLQTAVEYSTASGSSFEYDVAEYATGSRGRGRGRLIRASGSGKCSVTHRVRSNVCSPSVVGLNTVTLLKRAGKDPVRLIPCRLNNSTNVASTQQYPLMTSFVSSPRLYSITPMRCTAACSHDVSSSACPSVPATANFTAADHRTSSEHLPDVLADLNLISFYKSQTGTLHTNSALINQSAFRSDKHLGIKGLEDKDADEMCTVQNVQKPNRCLQSRISQLDASASDEFIYSLNLGSKHAQRLNPAVGSSELFYWESVMTKNPVKDNLATNSQHPKICTSPTTLNLSPSVSLPGDDIGHCKLSPVRPHSLNIIPIYSPTFMSSVDDAGVQLCATPSGN